MEVGEGGARAKDGAEGDGGRRGHLGEPGEMVGLVGAVHEGKWVVTGEASSVADAVVMAMGPDGARKLRPGVLGD